MRTAQNLDRVGFLAFYESCAGKDSFVAHE